MKHIDEGDMIVGWQTEFNKTDITPPKGYSTVSEIAKRLGLSESHVRAKLRILHDDGKVDRILIKKDKVFKYYYKD